MVYNFGFQSGGIEDTVKDGQTGILIDPTNTKEITKSLERLFGIRIYDKNLEKMEKNGQVSILGNAW